MTAAMKASAPAITVSALAQRIEDRVIERVERAQDEWLFEEYMDACRRYNLSPRNRDRLADTLGVEA